ncbi:hypothetical protein Krac_3698 [Ktedonobacter racemifer DSM 44963]|uniref:Uncharacterized protein n=1 Tax=Ktedonobacter racemifer DSM 44963 TaxID=485913 RepID=D6U2T6_KTERA|nr:hypothetical protein Krac_3698 [Ktedonobacter racemifer DSM 44963]
MRCLRPWVITSSFQSTRAGNPHSGARLVPVPEHKARVSGFGRLQDKAETRIVKFRNEQYSFQQIMRL